VVKNFKIFKKGAFKEPPRVLEHRESPLFSGRRGIPPGGGFLKTFFWGRKTSGGKISPGKKEFF